MHGEKADALNILDDKDSNFILLHNVMDSYFRQLHGEEIGARPHNSDFVNTEEEEQLWVSGIMGIILDSSFRPLSFTVDSICVFVVTRSIALLKYHSFSGWKFLIPRIQGKCYEYTEHGSKNNHGCLKQLTANKVVHHFANAKLGVRCFVSLLYL